MGLFKNKKPDHIKTYIQVKERLEYYLESLQNRYFYLKNYLTDQMVVIDGLNSKEFNSNGGYNNTSEYLENLNHVKIEVEIEVNLLENQIYEIEEILKG